MKKFIILLMVACLLCITSSAQNVAHTPQGVKVSVNGITTECVVYTPEIIRVVKYPSYLPTMPHQTGYSVVLEPQKTSFSHHISGNSAVIKTSAVAVTVNLKTGVVSFADAKGKAMIKETEYSITPITKGANKGDYQVAQTWKLDKDEPLYGLGILQDGALSLRGKQRRIEQTNLEDFVNIVHSIKGYGIFWEEASTGEFSDDPVKGMTFSADVADGINYYYMQGGNADGVIAQIRRLTGEIPMMPLWYYGFIQSRERYTSQDELMEVVKRHRELQIPLDVIVQDWQYWAPNHYLWNAMEFLNYEFPDPQGMIDFVHNQHAKIMLSIWPNFGIHTKQYADFKKRGWLIDVPTYPFYSIGKNPDYPSGVRPYNVYNPEARDLYWQYVHELYKLGIDAWWMDATDDPDNISDSCFDIHVSEEGTFRKLRNLFPLLAVGNQYDNIRKQSDNHQRVCILTRSAYAGQQRYGSNTWSGDIQSSWESFRQQIPAGLGFSMAGFAHYNTDIGGFVCKHYRTQGHPANENPLFRELVARWTQFAVFEPAMRSHGAYAYREIYNMGQPGDSIYTSIEKAIHMRYALLPYIYSTAWQVTNGSGSFMRPLVMDYPEDTRVWNMGDEYLFGQNFLVKPITSPKFTPEEMPAEVNFDVDFQGAQQFATYLPKGLWYDYWTEQPLQGGQEHSRDYTLSQFPVYVKAGTILTVGPDVQYSSEKAWDDMEIVVYPGADGSFTLYEDEGDDYGYENGAYSTITFTWDDAKSLLKISPRKGSFPGMIQQRKFRVRLAGSAIDHCIPVSFDADKGTSVRIN